MLLLDSADIQAIRPLMHTGLISGVTTNPTILKRAGLGFNDIGELDKQLRDCGVVHRFYQTVGTSVDEMLRSAQTILNLGESVTVKIPAVAQGFEASAHLVDAPVLLTAIYHPTQAFLASQQRVNWIAPYVGRMDDIDGNGIAHTALMVDLLEPTNVQILAASIRSLEVFTQLLHIGVHHFTISPQLCTELINQPNAMQAWADFEADFAQMNSPASSTGKDV